MTEAEPGYADGWLNVARALIQEGETDAAKPYIAEALKRDPSLGRIYYFKALIEKADGDYDGGACVARDGVAASTRATASCSIRLRAFSSSSATTPRR